MSYKIKLLAIAKDEAAYLPEWIHHHLYFGIDAIQIYINNTKDNSVSILKKIGRSYPVSFVIKDDLYRRSGTGFQANAYTEMVAQAKREGYTHAFLLDIDEFWTPLDFSQSLKSAIYEMGDADCYLFNWNIHKDESVFSHCFQNKLKVEKRTHVKCLINLNSDFKKVGIHNVYGKDLKYKTSNGERYYFHEEDNVKAILEKDVLLKPLPSVVIHRLYRSQMEYISMLMRGRPQGVLIKNNRNGYYNSKGSFNTLELSDNLLEEYYQSFDVFKDDLDLAKYIEKAREYIKLRYQEALFLFRSDLCEEDKSMLCKALRGICIPEVKDILKEVSSSKSYQPLTEAQHINRVFEAALFYERNKEFNSAFKTMKLLDHLRPNDDVFSNKMELYKFQRRKLVIDHVKKLVKYIVGNVKKH